MYPFEDLDAVHAALNLLMRREPPLVRVLPRQPGTKESRYLHLFSGDTAARETASQGGEDLPSDSGRTTGNSRAEADRITELENEVLTLRREMETLREQFAAFQKQFQ
jgi:uncharacterized protein YceH (UPF0502 family)